MGHHMITRSKKQMITRSKKTSCLKREVLTQTKRKEGKKQLFPTRKPGIPFELVAEILSWLSVNCLLRLKSVCRQWYELIQERSFVEKHMIQSKIMSYHPRRYKDRKETFQWELTFDGLVLERGPVSKKYRIRNLATRRVFDLPKPEHDNNIDMNFGFARGCGYYKAVSLYACKEGNKLECGFEILTLGSEEKPSWRALDTAYFRNLNTEKEDFWSMSAGGVAYYVRTSKVEPLNYEVLSLDLDNECFTSSTFHRSLFSNTKNRLDIILWEGKLSVTEMENDELYVMECQDYKKGKWAQEKIVVPLKFLEEYPQLKAKQFQPTFASCNNVYFRMKGRKGGFIYSIEKKRLLSDPIRASKKKANILAIRQTLVDFKGMRLLP